MDQNRQNNQHCTCCQFFYYNGRYYFQDEHYLYPVQEEVALQATGLGYNQQIVQAQSGASTGYNQPTVQAQSRAPTYRIWAPTPFHQMVERFSSLFVFDPSNPIYSLWGHGPDDAVKKEEKIQEACEPKECDDDLTPEFLEKTGKQPRTRPKICNG